MITATCTIFTETSDYHRETEYRSTFDKRSDQLITGKQKKIIKYYEMQETHGTANSVLLIPGKQKC